MRRRRFAALAGFLVVAGAAVSLVAVAASPPAPAHVGETTTARPAASATGSPGSAATSTSPKRAQLAADVAVGLRTVTFVDRSRTVHFLNGSVEPRTLVTEIRYPAMGPGGANDIHNATPIRLAGPYPLVIFGHGFGVTPDIYAPILDAWARAGYVVAAPVFQLGSPAAPGGLNEADLVNWPADMSFVISGMLAGNVHGPLRGLIERSRIAVSGQSDGGDTALALAFDPRRRDRRVDAAVILSGAEIPELGPFAFPSHGPPLLATQGSADTINLPGATSMFFSAAPRPKFLLTLLGAAHLPPYTTEQPYLGIVERVTVAFLDHYLGGGATSLHSMVAAGSVAGAATLISDR